MARNTHERIIAGARALFFALGYDGTRLERLAQKLGITKKTIYNHFRSKEDLLFAVLDADLREWINETRDIVREPELEMGDRFLKLQSRAISALERRARLFPAPSGGIRQRMRARIEAQFVGELAAIFADVVELAKRSGYLLPDVDPILMAHVLINIGARIAAYCSMPSVPYDTGTLLSESLHMTLAGVLTDLGRARLEELRTAGAWTPHAEAAGTTPPKEGRVTAGFSHPEEKPPGGAPAKDAATGEDAVSSEDGTHG